MLVKKHISMMTAEEKRFIEEVVLPKAKVKFLTKHAKDQAKARDIHYTLKDFQDEICLDNLIEFNNNNGKMAMLFTSKKVVKNRFKGKSHIKFVLGFNYAIVSTWANNVKDHHKTLDLAQYNKNAKVEDLYTGWVDGK